MTRMLFADQYGEMGGGQTVLMSLLRAALKTGGQVSVLAPGGGTLESAIATVRLFCNFCCLRGAAP